MCPHCSVSLTWHRRWRALRCHYCDYTIPRPQRCASCGDPALGEWGSGTEQIEALLRERFPAARIVRMDRDTTQRKGSQAEMLRAWADGSFDIMVGTQMITKGHDVPGVTLTGYLDDIRPAVASAAVSVSPIHTGGGTRLKILESMALHTPVVATSKGAEGLEVVADEHLLMADTPDAFAEAVVRLLRSPDLQRQIAANAYHLVGQRYDAAVILPAFLELAAQVASS